MICAFVEEGDAVFRGRSHGVVLSRSRRALDRDPTGPLVSNQRDVGLYLHSLLRGDPGLVQALCLVSILHTLRPLHELLLFHVTVV